MTTQPPANTNADGSFRISDVWLERHRRRKELLKPFEIPEIRPEPRQKITWVGDLQQGDGGKGAMVDRLAAHHNVVARIQGGDNAGHTSVFRLSDDREMTTKSHLIPSGLRHPSVIGLLANGVLLNPEQLASELAELGEVSSTAADRLYISDRAHIVLPLHRVVDELQERERTASGTEIGTTGRGIGPANVSKINRIGVRVRDLENISTVVERIRENVEFFHLDQEEIDHNVKWVNAYRAPILKRSIDSINFVSAAVEAGYSVLFEGAQGPLIDPEHGLYPYVTTSPTAFYSVSTGSGLDSTLVTHRIGVLKAYQTMVGNGAFVTEDFGAVAERLRRQGNEYGTTTTRPRRCGWVDLVHAGWAVSINRYTNVVVTKIDVLDGFDQIGVCVAYKRRGVRIFDFVPEHEFLAECVPEYYFLPGWRGPTSAVRSYEELPEEVHRFINFMSAYLGVEVAGVTVGPRTDDFLPRPGYAHCEPFAS